MNVEFTQEDIKKLDELIQVTPFRYAYPFFQYFQGKFNEASKPQTPVNKAEDGSESNG